MENQVEALGPTGARVGRRLNELRRERDLTLGELADKLKELGRPILLSALSKIEKGQRRVDVDDLVALALALDVSPNVILLPEDARLDIEVQLTPWHAQDAASAWRWAGRDQPPQLAGVAADFFISYVAADRAWAEWIAWQLEEAGYAARVQAWDFLPGSNFVGEMEQALRSAQQTIAILSESYIRSPFAAREWQAALAAQGASGRPKLLPVRVGPVQLSGVLNQIVYVDLVGLSKDDARAKLLNAVSTSRVGRGKPSTIPAFPAMDSERLDRPDFPS